MNGHNSIQILGIRIQWMRMTLDEMGYVYRSVVAATDERIVAGGVFVAYTFSRADIIIMRYLLS